MWLALPHHAGRPDKTEARLYQWQPLMPDARPRIFWSPGTEPACGEPSAYARAVLVDDLETTGEAGRGGAGTISLARRTRSSKPSTLSTTTRSPV